jgi:hypothetical protein
MEENNKKEKKKNNIIILTLLILLTVGIITFNYSNQLVALFVEGAAPNPGHSLTEIEGGADLATKTYVDTAMSGITGSNWIVGGSNLYRLDGNVGIGTANPIYTLDLASSTTSTTLSVGSTTSNTSHSGIRFVNDSHTNSWIFAAGSEYSGLGGPGSFNIYNTGVGPIYIGNGTNILYMIRNGNVGIGIASPTTKLDVAGTIRGIGLISNPSGQTRPTCDSSNEGMRWYDYNIKKIFLCNGNDWLAIGIN